MSRQISTGPKLALITEHGEIQTEGLELSVDVPKRPTKRFTMVYQADSQALASHPEMGAAATWRVLWALVTYMPMRQGLSGPPANEFHGTQDDLAELTGLNRSTVNRAVQTLKRIGIVELTGNGRLCVSRKIASRGAPRKGSLTPVH